MFGEHGKARVVDGDGAFLQDLVDQCHCGCPRMGEERSTPGSDWPHGRGLLDDGVAEVRVGKTAPPFDEGSHLGLGHHGGRD